MKNFLERMLTFWRDTRHLWVLMMLLVVGGAAALAIRSRLIPKSFGQLGPYRTAALESIAATPSVFLTDATCQKCHKDVEEERAESLHKAVRCTSCHGLGREHVAEALRAAESPDFKIPPAQPWDGNFLTHVDLYITKDRTVCLVCHEDKVGMPEGFKKIRLAEHLKEMGASAPESRETCFECHGGHNTAP
jgi:hypothetical protein